LRKTKWPQGWINGLEQFSYLTKCQDQQKFHAQQLARFTR
jgi:hypothetical protein